MTAVGRTVAPVAVWRRSQSMQPGQIAISGWHCRLTSETVLWPQQAHEGAISAVGIVLVDIATSIAKGA